MSNRTASITIHSDSAFEQALLVAAVGEASRIAIQLPRAWEMVEEEETHVDEMVEDIVCKIYGNGKAVDLAKTIISESLNGSMHKDGVYYISRVLNEIAVAAAELADALEGKGY